MKRIALLLAGSFLLIANVSFSQAIDDRTVIPVAVTLNSILRLNVVSGGNIEFSFNTLADYTNGIENSAAYDTKLTIASSVDWDLIMYAEDSELIGTDDATGANTMNLDNIGYRVSPDGSNDQNVLDIPSFNGTQALTNTEIAIVGYDGTNSNAGDINANAFTIHWRCGTQDGAMNGDNLLTQGLSADRYATNVFLVLQPN
jgi:hypothetical protein